MRPQLCVVLVKPHPECIQFPLNSESCIDIQCSDGNLFVTSVLLKYFFDSNNVNLCQNLFLGLMKRLKLYGMVDVKNQNALWDSQSFNNMIPLS